MTLRPRHLIIPMAVTYNTQLQPLDREVYGVIYWFSKMSKEECTASNEVISEVLTYGERKVNPKSVSNSVSRLEKTGCVQVLLKPNKQRIEIIPLVKDEPLPDEIQDVVPSNDGRTMEASDPLNDGTNNSGVLIDPSNNGGNNEIVPSDDGRPIIYDNFVPSNDGGVIHHLMEDDPSFDGQNNNIEKQELNNNINNSSNEELERLKKETFRLSEEKREKPKQRQPSKKLVVDTSRDEEIFDILRHFNQERGKNYKSISGIRTNVLKYLEDYTVEDIKTAISNIKYDEWWHNKDIELETVFRFKDKNGEPVDRIGRFLNVRKPNKPNFTTVSHRHNFDQELMEQELREKQKLVLDSSEKILEEELVGQTSHTTFTEQDIDQGMALLHRLLGANPPRYEDNITALTQLYEERGIERTHNAIEYAFKVKSDRYAPVITNYKELARKWEPLKRHFDRHYGADLTALQEQSSRNLDGSQTIRANGISWRV